MSAFLQLRLKDAQEGAEPSGACISIANLYRLADLFPKEASTFVEQARKTVSTIQGLMSRAPVAIGSGVSAARLDEKHQGIKQVRSQLLGDVAPLIGL